MPRLEQLHCGSLRRRQRHLRAGVYLRGGQVAGDRGLALDLRTAAIDAIGQVGFTEAGPMLAGLALRLEGRRAGQMTMLFAPTDWPEDQALLPALKETLRLLAEDQ